MTDPEEPPSGGPTGERGKPADRDALVGPEDSTLPTGQWLVERRSLLDRGEAVWLRALAHFDRHQLWSLDGQLHCVDWLMWTMNMSRAMAFEKLRVAYALERRPALAAAFEEGAIPWSAVRILTRLDDPDPMVDEALIELARSGGVRDLEAAVRYYRLCLDQELPADLSRLARRGLRLSRGLDGFGTLEATVDEFELEELDIAIRAFMDPPYRATSPESPVEESPRVDAATPVWVRRADALMALVRTAMAHRDQTAEPVDRYLVHIVVDAETGAAERLDGTPVDPAGAAQVLCDAPSVTHTLGQHGETLRLGRKTRVWSAAQFRAIVVRDGGVCRFPGCQNRICDIHHLKEWTDGGATDVDNGLLMCRRHHTLIHRHGYSVAGAPDGALAFRRPDGGLIDVTQPRRRRWVRASVGPRPSTLTST